MNQRVLLWIMVAVVAAVASVAAVAVQQGQQLRTQIAVPSPTEPPLVTGNQRVDQCLKDCGDQLNSRIDYCNTVYASNPDDLSDCLFEARGLHLQCIENCAGLLGCYERCGDQLSNRTTYCMTTYPNPDDAIDCLQEARDRYDECVGGCSVIWPTNAQILSPE